MRHPRHVRFDWWNMDKHIKEIEINRTFEALKKTNMEECKVKEILWSLLMRLDK